MSNVQVLLLIAGFLVLTVGSFVWYVATWDNRNASAQPTSIILPKILSPTTIPTSERATT
jgi:hypothetical protein